MLASDGGSMTTIFGLIKLVTLIFAPIAFFICLAEGLKMKEGRRDWRSLGYAALIGGASIAAIWLLPGAVEYM